MIMRVSVCTIEKSEHNSWYSKRTTCAISTSKYNIMELTMSDFLNEAPVAKTKFLATEIYKQIKGRVYRVHYKLVKLKL